MAPKQTRAGKVSVDVDRETVRQLQSLFRNNLRGISTLADG